MRENEIIIFIIKENIWYPKLCVTLRIDEMSICYSINVFNIIYQLLLTLSY